MTLVGASGQCLNALPHVLPVVAAMGLGYVAKSRYDFESKTYENLPSIISRNCSEAIEEIRDHIFFKSAGLQDICFNKECEHPIRLKAFKLLSRNAWDMMRYEFSLEALDRSDCAELELIFYISDMEMPLRNRIKTLWQEKMSKGDCQTTFTQHPLDQSPSIWPLFSNFVVPFNDYVKNQNWIGVCRIAYLFTLTFGQKDLYIEIIDGLSQLLKQETVSLGLKEITYSFLKEYTTPSQETYEYLRNHFIEKGDLIRAERLPKP